MLVECSIARCRNKYLNNRHKGTLLLLLSKHVFVATTLNRRRLPDPFLSRCFHQVPRPQVGHGFLGNYIGDERASREEPVEGTLGAFPGFNPSGSHQSTRLARGAACEGMSDDD